MVAQALLHLLKACLMPYVVTTAQNQVSIILTNPTNNVVTFRSGTLIGNLVEPEIIYSVRNPEEKALYNDSNVSISVL